MNRSRLALGAASLLWTTSAWAGSLEFRDPSGDDNAWGSLRYPTGKEYAPGAFDLVGVQIREDGDDVVFEVSFKAQITDPWNSKDWGGNGFSLQFVQIYLDTDGKRRSGERRALPGAWVEFTPDAYYEKVVLISPQPTAKLKGEVKAKAKRLLRRVVFPTRTEARQNTLVARVPKKLVGTPKATWGVQALVLSNEGFAAKEDILARRVNEYEGEHRFGGGCDGLGDAQVVDIFAGQAQGSADEVEAQHKALKGYTCADTIGKAKMAKIPMIRRGRG